MKAHPEKGVAVALDSPNRQRGEVFAKLIRRINREKHGPAIFIFTNTFFHRLGFVAGDRVQWLPDRAEHSVPNRYDAVSVC